MLLLLSGKFSPLFRCQLVIRKQDGGNRYKVLYFEAVLGQGFFKITSATGEKMKRGIEMVLFFPLTGFCFKSGAEKEAALCCTNPIKFSRTRAS